MKIHLVAWVLNAILFVILSIGYRLFHISRDLYLTITAYSLLVNLAISLGAAALFALFMTKIYHNGRNWKNNFGRVFPFILLVLLARLLWLVANEGAIISW